MEYLDRAINGNPGNTGYKLEFRFHALLGTIRMGNRDIAAKEFINLADAEAAFLSTARYARHDFPKDSGTALLAAGMAAYSQGKMQEAVRYTEEALLLIPHVAEGHFQLAKIRMHLDQCDGALPSLKRAIEMDRDYSIKAAGDGDFRRYDSKVYELIDTLRRDVRPKAENLLAATQRQALETELRQWEDFVLAKYVNLGSAKRAVEDASRALREDTYYGFLNTIDFCTQAKMDLQKAIAQFLAEAETEAKKRIDVLNHRIHEIKTSEMSDGWLAVVILGVILSIVLGFVECGRILFGNDGGEHIITAFWCIVTGSGLAIFCASAGNDKRKKKAIKPLEIELKRVQRIAEEISQWGERAKQS